MGCFGENKHKWFSNQNLAFCLNTPYYGARGSGAKIKIIGENGHPCLMCQNS